MRKQSEQQGIALLMAILIVAMVAIVSVHMLTQRQLQFYRTANLFFRDQAYHYSLAVEGWGKSVLFQDYERKKKVGKNSLSFDSHQDIWNTALVEYELEQGTLEGSIFDLQGRFNLNNIVKDGQVNTKWLNSYKRLLVTLDLPVALAEALLDWLDTDEQPTGTFGAEDIYYIALEQPYRAANQHLVNVSELLLVKGYDKEAYKRLKPYVYVASEETKVNINTSSEEVLQAIVPGLSASQASSLITQISNSPFGSMEKVQEEPILKDKAIDTQQVSVSSSYFVVNGFVHVDKTKTTMQSIVKRSDLGNVEVLNRQNLLIYENNSPENTDSQ